MNSVFTDKQTEEIRAFKANEFKRLNIYDGSVRSGKTWISVVIWVLWVVSRKQKGKFLMCAKTVTALKRNVLDLAVEIFGENNVQYSISQKKAYIFGREVELEGANDSRSEAKIRGMTLLGAYCDELTLFPEDFFKMLLSRLSVEGAKLFGTTNPDNPQHWLMRDFLDPKVIAKKGLNIRRSTFLLDDNTTLSPDYVTDLKKEYNGVFYDRFILGKWVAAEGAIYRIFSENRKKYIMDTAPDNIVYSQIGVDFGGNGSAHAFVCTGISRDHKSIVTLDEYYSLKENLSPSELEANFVSFVKRNAKYNPVAAFADNAEQTLIQGFRLAAIKAGLGISIQNARKGPIVDRIRFYNMLFNREAYKIMSHCTHLIEAFEGALWDGKSLDDKRLDDGSSNIDSLDAQEYSTENLQMQIQQLLGMERR